MIPDSPPSPSHRTRDLSSSRDYRGSSVDHQIFVIPDQIWCRVNNNESAGKRQSGRTTPGNRWLKTALVQAAWAAARARGTHLSEKFRRVAGRRGGKRAAVAVGHMILVIIYHLLKEGTSYQEIGGEATAA